MMNLKNSLKTVFGAIILGVVGSALWEKMLSPLFDYVVQFLLTVSTLGIESLKDEIYQEIAIGFHEQASVELLLIISMTILGFITATTIFVSHIKSYKQIKHKQGSSSFKLLEKFSVIENGYFLWTYLVFAVVFFTFYTVRIIYINRLIAYYEQLLNIVAIDLSEEDYKNYRSRFAQIREKDDYVVIINELSEGVENSNKVLPNKPTFIF